MLQWTSNLACKVGLHDGDWVYKNCVQTRICRRCGEKTSIDVHNVEHWESVGSNTESGGCERCGQIVTRTYKRDAPIM